MSAKESKANFDKLISESSPQVRNLAKKSRTLLLKAFPGASEKIISGWGGAFYGVSDKTNEAIFSISLQKSYMQIYFLQGSELSDPDGILEGAGKKLRHVNICEAADLKRTALLRLMKRAVAHGKKGNRK